MASEQDIWELIVKTVGQEDLKKLEAGLKDLNETASDVGETTEKAAKGSRNMGGAALEASRALEDLQYGIGGVLNNLPGLVAQLGGGAGLAGAISLLAIGATQVAKHWPELMELFGNTKPIQDATADIKDLEKEIKALEDKKVKVAVDYADIERAKKELKDLTAAEAEREAQKKQQKTTEAEAGKLIQDLITESAEGAAEIQRRTVQAFAERSKAQSATISGIDAEIKRQKELLAVELDPDRIRIATMRIEELRAERTQAGTVIEQKAGTQYAGLLEKAKTGHGAEQIRAREDLSTLIRDAGFKPLADAIESTTAAGLEAFDKEAADFERHMDRAKTAGQSRREKAAAVAKKTAATATEAKKDQAAIDKSVDAWAKEGEDFIADRERAANKVATNFLPTLKKQASAQALDVLGTGASMAEVQGALKTRATGILRAGGVEAGLIPGAAQAMAARMAEGLQAQQAGGGVEAFRKQESRARQIFQQSQALTGVQFTPEQSRAAAAESIKLQAKGVGVNQATLTAMGETIQAMRQLMIRVNQQGAQAAQHGRDAQQLRNHAAERQPGAGNTGGH